MLEAFKTRNIHDKRKNEHFPVPAKDLQPKVLTWFPFTKMLHDPLPGCFQQFLLHISISAFFPLIFVNYPTPQLIPINYKKISCESLTSTLCP